MDKYDKAGEILLNTNDGNKLSRHHLWLLQTVINGYATEEGTKAFDDVYNQVIAGTYEKKRKAPKEAALWYRRS